MLPTVDVDGDGKPDLVSTGELLAGETKIWGAGASPHWNVYTSNGAGFAPAPAFEVAAKLVLDVLRKLALVRSACMQQESRHRRIPHESEEAHSLAARLHFRECKEPALEVRLERDRFARSRPIVS